MTRREKLDEIERMENAEISAIYEKYKPLKDSLAYQFKIEDIKAEGWVRDRFYGAMVGRSWFYVNNKYPKLTIFISFEKGTERITRVSTYGGVGRNLVDMDDLIDFQTNGK